MITKDKKYTSRLGLPVTIYEIYENEIHGVIHCSDSFVLQSWTKAGLTSREGKEGCNDLIEVSPYADWKIDDKFLVSSYKYPEKKYRYYFAGLNSKGLPLFYTDGRTSWSTNIETTIWDLFEPFKED